MRGAWVAWVGRGVALLPLVVLAWQTWFVCDDAYITGRYAQSVARGLGFVFNRDGSPPVEGFSDLLWVVAGAGIERLGGRSPEVLPWVSLAAGVVGLAVAGRVAERAAGPGPATAATAVAAAFPPLAVWATSGLEAMAWAAALVVLLEALMTGRAGLASAAMLGLATVRAEGPLWGLCWLGIAAWGGAPRGSLRAAAGALGVATVGLVVWRLVTFGAWLPHTAVVKVHPTAGGPLRGLAWVALAGLTWLTPLAAPLLTRTRTARPEVAPWLAGAAAVVGFGVVVGGDYLPMHRFLVPVWLLLVPPLAVALRGLSGPALVAATAALVTVGGLPLVPVHLAPEGSLWALQRAVGTKDDAFRPDVVALRKERYRSGRRVAWARALAAVTEPGMKITARGVGALGYETELVVLDPYGLVTPEVVAEARPRAIAPGHDVRVSRGFFLGHVPDILFAAALAGRSRSEVIDQLPRQWGLFEELAPDEAVYVAEVVAVPEPAPEGPAHLLLVRRLVDGEEPEALRTAFKDQVRAAGFRSPRLEPLDERRREVALAKRRGADVRALLDDQRREAGDDP